MTRLRQGIMCGGKGGGLAPGVAALESETVQETARELEEQYGLHPEEASVEAALNLRAAMGVVDAEPVAGVTAGAASSSDGPDYHSAYDVWYENVNNFLAALQKQEEGKNLPPATRRCGGTSLVLFPLDCETMPGSVNVVDWQCEDASAGRVVDVDGEGNLKTVICVGPKQFAQNFRRMGARIIVPQTGVTWSRDRRRGFGRVLNKLPEFCLILIQMWRVTFQREGESRSGSQPSSTAAVVSEETDRTRQEVAQKCDICKCYDAPQTVQGSNLDMQRPVACPACNLCAHESCFEAMYQWTRISRGSQGLRCRVHPGSEVPEQVGKFLCRLCSSPPAA